MTSNAKIEQPQSAINDAAQEEVNLERDALATRLFQATLGLFDILGVYLGVSTRRLPGPAPPHPLNFAEALRRRRSEPVNNYIGPAWGLLARRRRK